MPTLILISFNYKRTNIDALPSAIIDIFRIYSHFSTRFKIRIITDYIHELDSMDYHQAILNGEISDEIVDFAKNMCIETDIKKTFKEIQRHHSDKKFH